jgi:hypothetical protein
MHDHRCKESQTEQLVGKAPEPVGPVERRISP